jgi:hypothetical protein
VSDDSTMNVASCPACGAQAPVGARFCLVCGQALGMQQASPLAPPVAPALPRHDPIPGDPVGYGYPPARARGNSVPILVGLGLLGLVLALVAGALLVVVAGGAHATSAPSAIALATETAAPSSANPAPSAAPSSTPTRAPSGTFSPTGSMADDRQDHTATLLLDGRVLIAGGLSWADSGTELVALATAELYDPATGEFSPTGSMTVARENHTATRLDDGRVLITGGWDGHSGYATAELYDPATGTFSPTGSMASVRAVHTATPLPDGRVLIAGGATPSVSTDAVTWDVHSSADIYDPRTGKFTPTGSMAMGRWHHAATALADGRVLVVGGAMNPAYLAELYDVRTGKFTRAGSMNAVLWSPTVTSLSDGRVLVAGGSGQSKVVASAELYDPAAGAFTATRPMTAPRQGHQATLLLDGRVLVTGGQVDSADLGSAEIYIPEIGSFASTGKMTTGRSGHTATVLLDGRVLIVGPGTSAELYQP